MCFVDQSVRGRLYLQVTESVNDSMIHSGVMFFTDYGNGTNCNRALYFWICQLCFRIKPTSRILRRDFSQLPRLTSISPVPIPLKSTTKRSHQQGSCQTGFIGTDEVPDLLDVFDSAVMWSVYQDLEIYQRVGFS